MLVEPISQWVLGVLVVLVRTLQVAAIEGAIPRCHLEIKRELALASLTYVMLLFFNMSMLDGVLAPLAV